MKPTEVRSIRHAISRALGRPSVGPAAFSQQELGEALGLAQGSARKTIERWEAEGPTGPAGIALTYLGQGALDDELKRVVPEYAFGPGLGDGGSGREIIVRLWWPRFIGVVLEGHVPTTLDSAWIEDEVERLAVAMWIDDPNLPGAPDPIEWVRRAATLIQIETQDAAEND
jgi:hypothetical protein